MTHHRPTLPAAWPTVSPTTCPAPGQPDEHPVVPLYNRAQFEQWFARCQNRTAGRHGARCWKCNTPYDQLPDASEWTDHDPTGLGRAQAYSCTTATAELYGIIIARHSAPRRR